jgi:hypothetical protein
MICQIDFTKKNIISICSQFTQQNGQIGIKAKLTHTSRHFCKQFYYEQY